MILAKKGNFILKHKIFLGRDKLTTHKLEICKKGFDNSLYTIVTIDAKFNLQSIDLRLLDAIQNVEDLEDVKILSKILYNIVRYTEDIECQ